MIEMTTELQNPATKAGYDMIYLVTCILHDITPEQNRVEQMELTQLYREAKNHSLAAMICMALEASEAFSKAQDEQLIAAWKDSKEKAIRKNLMLDAERSEILAFMEQAGIWYMPLKGILLKELYPKLGMRQMADNDILYDKKFQTELFQFLTMRGYKAYELGKGNHDTYYMEPLYNYELHTSLFGTASDNNFETYYRNVKQKLIKNAGSQYGYHFTDEDFYIYLMTHLYKHYSGNGTGLRSLVDIYVFLKQREPELNWHYISVELEELRLTDFERMIRELSKKLFSKQQYPLTIKESEALHYCLNSGTYGTMKNKVDKKLRSYQPNDKPITSITMIKYYLGRLFPDREHYKNYAPFVYRHKWMTPLYLIFRVVRGLIRKRKKLQTEIKILHSRNG